MSSIYISHTALENQVPVMDNCCCWTRTWNCSKT